MRISRAEIQKTLREAGELLTGRTGVRVLTMRDGMSDEDQAEWDRTVRGVPTRCAVTVIIRRFSDCADYSEAA